MNDDGAIDTMRDPRYDPPTRTHPLWFRGDNGRIIDCEFPLKNYAGKAGSAGDFKFDDSSTYEGGTEREQLITVEAMDALMSSNYHHYVPVYSELLVNLAFCKSKETGGTGRGQRFRASKTEHVLAAQSLARADVSVLEQELARVRYVREGVYLWQPGTV